MTSILVCEYGAAPGTLRSPPGDDPASDVLLSLAARAAPAQVSALEVPGAAGARAGRAGGCGDHPAGAPDDAAPLDSQELAAVRELAERRLAPAPDAGAGSGPRLPAASRPSRA